MFNFVIYQTLCSLNKENGLTVETTYNNISSSTCGLLT